MSFASILESVPHEISAIANRVRALILDHDLPIEEDIYGGKKVKMASYSIGRTDNVIAVIGPAANHCKLFLHHVDKIDPMGLKLEGKGKHAKHIKIFTLDAIDEAVYVSVIGQIAAIVSSKT